MPCTVSTAPRSRSTKGAHPTSLVRHTRETFLGHTSDEPEVGRVEIGMMREERVQRCKRQLGDDTSGSIS